MKAALRHAQRRRFVLLATRRLFLTTLSTSSRDGGDVASDDNNKVIRRRNQTASSHHHHHHHHRRIAEAKSRVRALWSPERWRQNNLRSRRWPSPRENVSNLDLMPLPTTVDAFNVTKPGRFTQNLNVDWPNVNAFSIEQLLDDYGEYELSVGVDDYTLDDVTVSLSDYIAYASRDADGDDAPLYIFDDWILLKKSDSNDCSPSLSSAYSIPSCFPHDYMSVMPGGIEERPPFCWLLIGTKRSGTALHVDPMSTAAWNTLVSGRKRWFLFPPKVEENDNDHGDYMLGSMNDNDDTANQWLHEKYSSLPESVTRGGFDFVQLPGETVYVPNSWQHAVINLDLSVAVTHNFVGPHNVQLALKSIDSSCSDISVDLSKKWMENMRRRGWL